MKRNWELIRMTLLGIDDNDEMCRQVSDKFYKKNMKVFSENEDEFIYNYNLLIDSNFIDDKGLTMKGYDFIEKIKNKNIWDESIKLIKEKNSGGVPYDILIYVLDKKIKERLVKV